MENNLSQKTGVLGDDQIDDSGVLVSVLVKVTEQFLAKVNSLKQVSDMKSRQDKLVSVMEHYDRLNMVIRVLKLAYPVLLENSNEKEAIDSALINSSVSAINSLSKIGEQLTNNTGHNTQHPDQNDTQSHQTISINNGLPDQQQPQPQINTLFHQQQQPQNNMMISKQEVDNIPPLVQQEASKLNALDHPLVRQQQVSKINPLDHQQQEDKMNVLVPKKVHSSRDIQTLKEPHTQKDMTFHQPSQSQNSQMVGRMHQQLMPVPKNPENMVIDSVPVTKKNTESINISSNVFLDQFENTARTFAAQNKMELSDVWESLFVHALPQDKMKWAENTILNKSLNWNIARKYYLKAFPDIHVQTPFKQHNNNNPPNGPSPSVTEASTRVNHPIAPPLKITMDERKRMIERQSLYAERLLSLEMKGHDTIHEYNRKFHRFSNVACMNLNDASLSKRYIHSLIPKYRLLVEKALANKAPSGLLETMSFAQKLIQAQETENKNIQGQVCWKHPNLKKRTIPDDNLRPYKKSSCA